MLAQYERRARGTPAPGNNTKDLSWKSVLGKFGDGTKNGERVTFCEEAQRRSRKVPSPSRYDAEEVGFDRRLLGVME